MSTAVMSSPNFECNEHLFKNSASKSKDSSSSHTTGGGHAPLRRSYTSLVTLIEQHRKLDRTVSEPTSRYKTELCRPFEESGSCKYGDKCQFAHGYGELRNLARHPKYKTELCRTFHTIGFCPYGPRCHFIHNFEEARIHNQKVSAQLGASTQPNIMGLGPLLNNSGAAFNLNMSLLEQITGAPQAIAAAAAAAAIASNPTSTNPSIPLMRTNSLNSTPNFTNNPALMRTNSLSLPAAHQSHQQAQNQQQTSVQIHQQLAQNGVQSVVTNCPPIAGPRPKPLNLSPTFSLGSTGDSISPSSSLSQSPTNSMASFFSDDSLNNNPTPFSFDFGILTRHTPSPTSSPVLDAPRTPSPVSPNAESRLPVFNRISSTIGDFENLKI